MRRILTPRTLLNYYYFTPRPRSKQNFGHIKTVFPKKTLFERKLRAYSCAGWKKFYETQAIRRGHTDGRYSPGEGSCDGERADVVSSQAGAQWNRSAALSWRRSATGTSLDQSASRFESGSLTGWKVPSVPGFLYSGWNEILEMLSRLLGMTMFRESDQWRVENRDEYDEEYSAFNRIKLNTWNRSEVVQVIEIVNVNGYDWREGSTCKVLI